jgi:hypothetical protein
MKEALRAFDLRDDEIAKLTPREVGIILGEDPPPPESMPPVETTAPDDDPKIMNGDGTPALEPEGRPTPVPPPRPDRDQLNTFIRVVFKHAAADNYVSLRAFYEGRADRPPRTIAAFKLDGNLDSIIDQAYLLAQHAAEIPEKVVVCPPVATFTSNRHAREADLAEGVVLNVECDKQASAARTKLEALLGPATLVIESGGVWTDPETKETEPKLHLYWLLKVPTRNTDEHQKLKEARKLATLIVGADTSNVTIVHPIRWPGSIHRKGEPKLCRIVVCNRDVEIDLNDALEKLRKVAGGAPASPRGRRNKIGASPAGGNNVIPFKIAPELEGLDPNQRLAEGLETPLLPFGPIKEGCAWFREAHETGGRDHLYPQWHLMLLGTVFMEDGRQLAHELGKEHPKYAVEETDERWELKCREQKEGNIGWPHCRTIHDSVKGGSALCKGCPHFPKDDPSSKRSPLHLALQQPRFLFDVSPNVANNVGVNLEDFYAYMPQHTYIFAPSREPWPAASVNARVPPVIIGFDDKKKPKTTPASTWIDRNQPVEMMTWAPGLPMIIANRLIAEGGWIERKGVSCFNLYRPPMIELGDASEAGPWIELVHKVYPNDAEHIIKWLAQRRQHPEIKINHGLVLGSNEHGIGKDTILEGAKRAIGSWNFKEISVKNLFDDFNPWRRAVILRVSEAKDMGEVNRFELYDGMKILLAAPPDVLECNEKHIKQHYVTNCMGVVITTNYLTNGIYLPAEDRRHYVAWSDLLQSDFIAGYWPKMWKWYDEGGDRHVAAYLATLDISDFDPKAPPPKTPAFWSIVNANRTTEEGELQDVFEKLGNPDAITIDQIRSKTSNSQGGGDKDSLWYWLGDRKNRKAASHRLEKCGYRAVNNPSAEADGLWRINGRRQVVYAKVSLSLGAQQAAAEALHRKAGEREQAARQKAAETRRAVEEEKERAKSTDATEDGFDADLAAALKNLKPE